MGIRFTVRGASEAQMETVASSLSSGEIDLGVPVLAVQAPGEDMTPTSPSTNPPSSDPTNVPVPVPNPVPNPISNPVPVPMPVPVPVNVPVPVKVPVPVPVPVEESEDDESFALQVIASMMMLGLTCLLHC